MKMNDFSSFFDNTNEKIGYQMFLFYEWYEFPVKILIKQ